MRADASRVRGQALFTSLGCIACHAEPDAKEPQSGDRKRLEQAVDVMLRVQVGRSASRADTDAIVKFLVTLNADPVAP